MVASATMVMAAAMDLATAMVMGQVTKREDMGHASRPRAFPLLRLGIAL